MSPVVALVNCKVRDVQVISLPGTLVIRQVSPFDQVVIRPLLIHTGRDMHTVFKLLLTAHFNLNGPKTISCFALNEKL